MIPIRGPVTTSTGARARARTAARSSAQPVVLARDAERLAEPARARSRAAARRRGRAAPASRRARASGSSARIEHGARDALVLAHEVEAPVDAVGAVDVGVARAGRTSTRCARCARGSRAPPGPRGRRPRPRRSARRRRRRRARRRSARGATSWTLAREERGRAARLRRALRVSGARSTRAGGARGGRGRRRRSGPARRRRRRAGRGRAPRRAIGALSAPGFAAHRGDDRPLGARGDDRLGDPLDPDARAGAVAALARRRAARARRSCRRARTCRSRGRSSVRAVGHGSIIPGAQATRAPRAAPRRRAPGPRARAARGTGSPSCARSQSSLTGQHALGEAEPLAHVRLEVDRRQVRRARDALGAEPRDHAVAVDARGQLHDVDEPRALVVGVVGERHLDVEPGEQLAVARRDLAARRRGSGRASRAGRSRARPRCRRGGS